MKPGDTRSVQVQFLADFPVSDLAGKKADYAVTLNEIKEKVLPPVDDAFAAKLLPTRPWPICVTRLSTTRTREGARS